MPKRPDAIAQRAAETVGERIRRLRKEANFTQAQLAQNAGINQGFLSSLEHNTRRPKPATVRALAIALSIPEAVIIGGGRDHDSPQPLETRTLPLYGTIPAGPPSQSQEQLEMFPVLRHLWGSDRYCLRLTFDSMEPTLKPNDLVLVHYRPDVDPSLVQGRICACLLDGNPTLKRVSVEHRNDNRVIILRGDNPAIPPRMVDDDTDFSIQGIVIKLVSRDL